MIGIAEEVEACLATEFFLLGGRATETLWFRYVEQGFSFTEDIMQTDIYGEDLFGYFVELQADCCHI